MKLLLWLLLAACSCLNVVRSQGQYDDSDTDLRPQTPGGSQGQGGTPQEAKEIREHLDAAKASAKTAAYVQIGAKVPSVLCRL